jgi:molecular chaperone Hsp33
MVRALASLGREEVETMIAEDGKIEIKCDLCNEPYTYTEKDVDSIFAPASSS